MSASTLPYGLKTPLTAKEYSELPEIIGYKDELIEGERVLTALPKLRHTLVIDNLASLLNRQFPNLRIAREAGWQFVGVSGLESVPGPDLMVVLPEDFSEALRSAGYFRDAPNSFLRSSHRAKEGPDACKRSDCIWKPELGRL